MLTKTFGGFLENDPKKAFTGKNTLKGNPLYLDENQTEMVPEKVQTVEFELLTIYESRLIPI